VPLLGRACADLGADVLALQEVDREVERSGRQDIAAVVADSCEGRHCFVPAMAMPGGGEYGNALVARGRFDAPTPMILPQLVEGEPRAALLTAAEVNGMKLSVAATHLSIHLNECRAQLQALLEVFADWPRPRVLMGDLNLEPPELESVEEAGFMLARAGGPTFPADAPRIRIDHIAVDGLEIDAVEVRVTPCSDHRALLARLTLAD
jgi:endonuclease/exonuclease/phosphatase family metal-dependent hydrolase